MGLPSDVLIGLDAGPSKVTAVAFAPSGGRADFILVFKSTYAFVRSANSFSAAACGFTGCWAGSRPAPSPPIKIAATISRCMDIMSFESDAPLCRNTG